VALDASLLAPVRGAAQKVVPVRPALRVHRKPRWNGAHVRHRGTRFDRCGRTNEAHRECEAPRRDSSLESLARLPGLVKGGTHTAGNSPGVNDGAGALVLASEDWAERNGKDVLGTIVAQAAVADEFAWLARTPANAAKKALDKAGLQPGDIDLWEINEAFSSVALNSTRMLGIDEERVNVNGGAVALGHPIGASGARIIGSLVLELRRRGGGYGCVAICSGGGQGDAVIVHV